MRHSTRQAMYARMTYRRMRTIGSVRRPLWFCWRAATGRGMRRADPLEPLPGARRLLAVGCDFDDTLPRPRRPLEVLLAPRANDADVQQRLRMLRIDGERFLELRERLVGLVGVVVRDPEIGTDVHGSRIDFERGRIP